MDLQPLLLVLAGGVLAIGGGWLQSRWNADQQRRREHEGRLYQRRADAYMQVLTLTRRTRQIMETTLPVIGIGERVPEAPTEDHIDAMDSALAAFGSSEVREQAGAMRKLQNRFWAKVETHRSTVHPADPLPPMAYEDAEAVRKDYRAAYDRLRDQITKELQKG